MTLVDLQITNLRNIDSLKWQCHPRLNVIFGENGSGKTALLEAIYLLGSGRSFRTREIGPLIRHEEEALVVFAKMDDAQTISLKKTKALPTQARINGESCRNSSELASFLPAQLFYQDLFQILDAGPPVRRQLLDWGVFHSQPDYHPTWKNYKELLKQRNHLLKQHHCSLQLLAPWDQQLTELATQLDIARKMYFLAWEPKFYELLAQVMDIPCTLQYTKGWDTENTGKSLMDILKENYLSDKYRSYTQYGAHQADLSIDSQQFSAKKHLSRGQQKMILFALKLAQAQLLLKPCTYLCDDLTAELDKKHVERLLTLMDSLPGQFFITALERSSAFESIKDKATFFSLDIRETVNT